MAAVVESNNVLCSVISETNSIRLSCAGVHACVCAGRAGVLAQGNKCGVFMAWVRWETAML